MTDARGIPHAAGTFGVTRTGGFAGALIRLGTRSQVNHAFVCLGNGEIVEARPRGAGRGHERQYPDAIYNDLQPLTDGQRDAIRHAASWYVGTPYGFADIAALALRCLFGTRWAWVEKRIASSRTAICSQLVDACYSAAGVRLFTDGRLPAEVTPGDLLLYIARHPWTAAAAAQDGPVAA